MPGQAQAPVLGSGPRSGAWFACVEQGQEGQHRWCRSGDSPAQVLGRTMEGASPHSAGHFKPWSELMGINQGPGLWARHRLHCQVSPPWCGWRTACWVRGARRLSAGCSQGQEGRLESAAVERGMHSAGTGKTGKAAAGQALTTWSIAGAEEWCEAGSMWPRGHLPGQAGFGAPGRPGKHSSKHTTGGRAPAQRPSGIGSKRANLGECLSYWLRMSHAAERHLACSLPAHSCASLE